jgi:hypothetical protein
MQNYALHTTIKSPICLPVNPPPPLLFSIYLNDLQEFLEGLNIKGIDSMNRDFENERMVYFKMFILLYADDAIRI